MFPGTDGLNVTVTVHFPPVARVEGIMGQLLLAPKSPLAVIDVMVNPALPLLVSVMAFPSLVVFSS